MAVGLGNHIFLALSIICGVVGSALLWRVFDSADASVINNPLQRLAQYESCSFIFFAVLNAIIIHFFMGKDQAFGVFRIITIGMLLYITIYSDYLSFNVLNNLRIVDMASSYVPFCMPVTGDGPLDHANRQKYLGGLIIGWFALFFGLLSTTVGQTKPFGEAHCSWRVTLFWVLALILLVVGNIVTWSSTSTVGYPYYQDTDCNNGDLTRTQAYTFLITTVVMVQWFVLTLGIHTASVDLLSGSAFIFGVASLYMPVYYFSIQATNPSNADYLWAGPILDWIAGFCMAVAAVCADHQGGPCASSSSAESGDKSKNTASAMV